MTFARFRATWRRSRSSGTLQVTVDAPRAARVRVELVRTAKAVQARPLALGRAGQVTRRLPLGTRLLPGRYTVRVREVGSPAGGRLPAGTLAASRPARKGGNLRVVWFWSGSSGPVASKGVRPVRGFAVSPLRNSRGSLRAGRYRAELRSGDAVVATAGVTLG